MAAVNNDIQFGFICPYESGFHKLREMSIYQKKMKSIIARIAAAK